MTAAAITPRSHASRGWEYRPSRPAERDVRPPLTRACDALDRSDDLPRRDDEPQVVPDRRHELLDQGAVLHEPGPGADLGERLYELETGLAPEDVGAPASEAGLHDDGECDVGRVLQ